MIKGLFAFAGAGNSTPKPTRTYTVNVSYKMIHQMKVEATSEREAIARAIETYADERDSDDFFDGLDYATIVE